MYIWEHTVYDAIVGNPVPRTIRASGEVLDQVIFSS